MSKLKYLLVVELFLTELLNVDSFESLFAVFYGRFGELLTTTELFHYTSFFKFSLKFLKSTFDVFTFFNRNYDHCKYLFLV